MFSIIDIETCGGKFDYRRGRIIEISILLHDGLTVVDKFTTLINPECYISPVFIRISGITNEMVANAPRFYEVAKKTIEMTEGTIFVAHNAGFDYGFIKSEFAHLGYKYMRDTLCTVRLSRKLLPGHSSYSLGKLCGALGIPIEGRHRAEGDATATAKLFDHLIYQKSMHPQYKNQGIGEIMTRRVDKIKKYILQKLPEECGVYYFLNSEGKIIYLGKSTNMYSRALSHFNAKTPKGRKLINDLYDVDFILTGSELIGLLVESAEIKKHKPEYNRVRKTDTHTHSIDWWTDDKEIINFNIVPYGEAVNSLCSFSTYLSARECLDRWIDEYTLCIRYCGLTSDDAICFNHHIKKCNGICADEEGIEEYNLRANKLLEQHMYKNNNFLIIDKGRTTQEHSLIFIEDGHYKGYGYMDINTQVMSPEQLTESIKKSPCYPDLDDIIRGWMNGKSLKIVKVDKNG